MTFCSQLAQRKINVPHGNWLSVGLCCALQAGAGLGECLVKAHTDATIVQRHMHRQRHAETPQPFKQEDATFRCQPSGALRSVWGFKRFVL